MIRDYVSLNTVSSQWIPFLEDGEERNVISTAPSSKMYGNSVISIVNVYCLKYYSFHAF